MEGPKWWKARERRQLQDHRFDFFFSPTFFNWDVNYMQYMYEWVSEWSYSVVYDSNPMDCNLPGSSLHGILQTRILEWVAIFFSRGSSWLRDKTWVSCSAGRLFTIWDTSYVYTSVITTQDHRIFHHLRKLPLQPSYNHFSDLSHHVLVLQTSQNLFGVLSTSLLSVFWLNSISSYISKKMSFFFIKEKHI